MHRNTWTLLTSLLLLASTSWLGFAPPVAADPPTVATGTFVLDTYDQTLVHADGVSGNAYYDYVGTGHYTGDLTGFLTFMGHFAQFRDGSQNFLEFDAGTGTIGGRTGDFSGVAGGTISPIGQIQGRESYTGTGGLAGLHLEGPFVQACAACTETYAFSYHFTP